MKRILLCLSLLAPVAVFAQDVHKPMTNMEATRQNTKMDLANKVQELDASMSRNNTENTQKVMNDLMASMQRYIATEANNMEKGKENETRKKLDKLNAVYSEVKTMSVDPAKNKQGIKTQVDAFIKLI